jgi:hypothetical protein
VSTALPELSGQCGGAPDFVEPIVGYRQWRLLEGRLRSLFSESSWLGPELQARCPVGGHDPQITPAQACSCGIYAYYDPCPRTASAATHDLIGGAVVVWGRIELHATGMRAEHARIVALALPVSRGPKRRAAAEVAERLGIPLVPHRRLRSAAAEHGAPLQSSLRPPQRLARADPSQRIGVLPRASLALVDAVSRRNGPGGSEPAPGPTG